MLLLQQNLQSADVTASLAGQQTSSSQGNLVAAPVGLPAGQQIVASAGTTATSLAQALSGAQTALAQGSATPATVDVLTGVSSAFQTGQIQEADAIMPSGVGAAFSQGSIIALFSQSIGGQTASLTQGMPVADQTMLEALSGESATGVVNSLFVDSSATVTGTGSVLVQEPLQETTSLSLTGLQSVGSLGSVVVNDATVLEPIQIIAAAGDVQTFASTNLVGSQLGIAQGVADAGFGITGLSIVLQQDNVSSYLNINHGGLTVLSEQGTPTALKEFFVGLNGESMSCETTTTFQPKQTVVPFGTAIALAIGTVTQVGGTKAIADIDGGYQNYGTDMRTSFAAQKAKRQREEWLDQAQQEDLLLLATIKSTLENPKYGF